MLKLSSWEKIHRSINWRTDKVVNPYYEIYFSSKQEYVDRHNRMDESQKYCTN